LASAPSDDDALDDSTDGAVFGGLPSKDAVIGGLVRVAGEVDAGSEEYDSRREENSGAEQVPDDDFNAAVSPRLGLKWVRLARGRWGGGHQIFPQNPL
jgi:hypothetical protein